MQELKANPHRNAKGTVIEAGLDKSKGPIATFIVQNGTLKRGDIVVCGEAFGKVGIKGIGTFSKINFGASFNHSPRLLD